VGTEPTRQQRQSTWCGEAARKAAHHAHDFNNSAWPLFLDGVTSASQQHGTTPCVGHKSVKELQSQASFSRTPLSLLKVRISTKSAMIQTCQPAYIVALGATQMFASKFFFAHVFPFFQKKEQ
jgi:hypothetical protein